MVNRLLIKLLSDDNISGYLGSQKHHRGLRSWRRRQTASLQDKLHRGFERGYKRRSNEEIRLRFYPKACDLHFRGKQFHLRQSNT